MTVNRGKRNPIRYDGSTPDVILHHARNAVQSKDFFTAFDLYEQLMSIVPHQSVEILSELYDVYQSLPDTTSRYWLYQGRHFNFGIEPHEKVLDIGSGNIPFPFATHLADLAVKDDLYGRAGVPFKYLDGKPVYECDVENMPFADKEFDFVYCSHVLEHTHNPEKACKELMRIAKRGYIETPTRGKDLFLHTGKVSNHIYFVENIDGTLIFTEYTPEELQGLDNDILLQMHVNPQTQREKAFSALIYLKSHLINTMLYWEHEFTVEVRKRSNNNTVKSSAVTHQPHTIQTEKENDVYALILHLYYPAFLEKHYKQFPNLSNAPIEIQKDSLIASRFGDSDFYSKNLHSHGWKTQDLILNAAPIQALWAQAHHIHTTSGLEISIAQIRAEKPTVVYFHDISIATKEYIEAIRPYVALIVGQIACPLFEGTYYHGFDILISSLPHFVERFRAMGIKAYYQPLAFESSLFTDIIPYHTRPVTCSFVGGISPIHTNSLRLLELLATTTDCEFWGYGAESLPPTSPIRAKHHGEVWGMDMFMTLQQSKITVNRHGAFAEDYANNMRLFEATGCGALLITDHKSNIEDLFVIGKEIITYSTPEECAEYVRYYSSHPEEAEIIAEAGRQRTLRDHSYHLRMNKTSQWLKRHLRYQSEDFSAVNIPISQVSSGHTFIDAKDLDDSLLNGWKNPDIPLRQRALVHNELQELYKGSPSRVYSIAAESMRYHLKNGSSLLEIGCSSGYYSEVLEYVLGKTFQYSGIDISESFIAMAKDYYPECSFIVADAKNIPFPKASFDIVFSSGAILYEIDYGKHIKETSRVARNVLIYHRTPICKKASTQLLKKKAYNVETVERIFNEQEFLSLIISEGWHLESSLVISEDFSHDYYDITYTFVRKSDNIIHTKEHTPAKAITMTLEGIPPFSATTQPEDILRDKAVQLMNNAVQYMQQNNHESALSELDEAIIHYPQIPNLQYLRSLCLWKTGKMSEAFIAMFGELKVAPHNEQVLYTASMASRAIQPYIESSSAYIQNIKQQIEMLRKFEFKIFSQSGEDGTLMGILSRVGTTNKKFMEIGIGNGDECNTANLSINHGWSGFLVDGDDQQVRNARHFYRHCPQVRVEQCFVTTDNINELLISHRVTGEIDVMSLDIDGNDYWILEKLNVLHPRVVILEYNPTFGPERSVTVPYDPEFYRMNYHKSGYYHGASLSALAKLMSSRGYILIGCDSNGYNSFFVRKDVAEGIFIEVPPQMAYYPAKPRFRHGSPEVQFAVIKELPLIEV